MNVLIIPDKFKGSLTASQVIQTIQEGLQRYSPSINTHSITASDGGDGFLEAIRKSNPSVATIQCETSDPHGRPMQAEYGFDQERGAAYIEMARASGMELLTVEERDPSQTSTFGTGIQIRHAINQGASNIYIGLGGSATNDGGIGIAEALGYRFLDSNGDQLVPTGKSLSEIETIDRSDVLSELSDVRIFAINDVANPLLGDEGAAAVYGPQKGADPEMVTRLDNGLDHLQKIVKRNMKIDAAELPGAGAAGGTGYGLKVFCNAEFLSGIEFVLSLTGIESLLADGQMDWIITGEGRIDDQTAYGKLVRGVADVGAKYDVPVVAICGLLDLQSKSIDDLGLKRILQLHDPKNSLDHTIKNAKVLLADAAVRILDPNAH